MTSLCKSLGILPGKRGKPGKPGEDGKPGSSIPGERGTDGPPGPPGGVTFLESDIKYPELVYITGSGPPTVTCSVLYTPEGAKIVQVVPFAVVSQTGIFRFEIPQFGSPVTHMFGHCYAVGESGKMYLLGQSISNVNFYNFESVYNIPDEGTRFVVHLYFAASNI